jgi:glucosaminylphosphatidylinositol acyltransferase
MQEHHSEYGVHWNFFFTLAYVACMGAVSPLHGRAAAAASLAAGTLHQLLLSQPGISEWLGADERDMSSFVDANKEGLVSLCGYAALFYAGSACSLILDYDSSKDASHCPQVPEGVITSTGACRSSVGVGDESSRHAEGIAHSSRGENDVKEGTSACSDRNTSEELNNAHLGGVMWWHARLWCSAAFMWVLVFLCDVHIQPVSRRFCNAAYVLWVTAMALTQLAIAAIAVLVVARYLLACKRIDRDGELDN